MRTRINGGMTVGIIAMLATILGTWLVASTASAAGMAITNIASSGASTSLLQDGDILTVDLVVNNATNLEFLALGLAVSGYDLDGNGLSGEGLEVIGGSVGGSVFSNVRLPGVPNQAFGGLTNLLSGISLRGEEEQPGFPLPTPAIPAHAALFEGVSLQAVNGDGSDDVGIGGDYTGNGDIHFQVQLMAVSNDVASIAESFTQQFGTYADGGQIAIDGIGESAAFTNASLLVNVVPEPGTALLMGLGLAGLASGRRSKV